MKFEQAGIYHIYNRGNFRQRIFYNQGNYNYFLNKCQHFLKPVCQVFAWCLMPNHFHFLIAVDEKSLTPIKSGGITMPAITNAFRLLQSSYAKGVNIQQKRTGNLFQQKTKSKLVSGKDDYTRTAFLYIHQNPVKAQLAKSMGEWEYSSWQEYFGKNNSGLCNTNQFLQLPCILARPIKKDAEGPIKDEDEEFLF
jgi:putative transposase